MNMVYLHPSITSIASQFQNRTQYPTAIPWAMQLQKYFLQNESFWFFLSSLRIIEILLTLACNIPFSFAMRVLQEHLRCRVSEYAQQTNGCGFKSLQGLSNMNGWNISKESIANYWITNLPLIWIKLRKFECAEI